MSNYSIKIDLLKLRGAFLRNLQGKTGTKRCLILPIDDTDGLFLGEKGLHLSLTAVEMREPRYNDTHCVKVNLPKAQRDTMSEEQRKAIPIIGGMHAYEQQPQQMAVNGTLGADAFDEDMPF